MFRSLATKFVPAMPRRALPSARAKYSAFGFTAAMIGGGTFVYCKEQPQAPPFNYSAVKKDIQDLLDKDLTVAPVIVRLAWHQAGTWDAQLKNGGSNSGSMRFAPECKHGANAGLEVARNLLEPIKKKHPSITYGDLWSLAGVLAIDAMGGPVVPWRWGRTEAKDKSECAPDGRLPDASLGVSHIRNVFHRMGFTDDREIVALIGCHTVGECHANRSGYVGPWAHDKLGFDTDFFTELLDSDWIVDKTKPNLQFKDSRTGKLMMLPTDIALLLDPGLKKWVVKYAADQEAFHREFSKAFSKLLEQGNHTLHELPKSA